MSYSVDVAAFARIWLLATIVSMTPMLLWAEQVESRSETVPVPTAEQHSVRTFKTLPPQDCWKCPGPRACGPSTPHHTGFLYYGTNPWDDDPINPLNDCPGGDCGHCGARLSLSWIRWHQPKATPKPTCPHSKCKNVIPVDN